MKHSLLRNTLTCCITFCILLLCAAMVHGQGANLPMPIVSQVGQLPSVESAAIPLTDPVWVKDGDRLREVVPGTEDYYNLRVKDICHIENGTLVPSVRVEGEVLQVLPESRLWLRKVALSRCEGGEGGYVGYARSDRLVVTVPDTNGFSVGTVRQFQLRQGAKKMAATLADGTVVEAIAYDQISSPTFEQYVALFTNGRSSVDAPVVLDVSEVIQPVYPRDTGRMPMSSADPGGVMRMPAGYGPMPRDPASREFRINEMTREQEDVSDLIRRRNIVIESLERDRDRATDPAERAALEDAIRRARDRSAEMEARVAGVSNAQLEARSDLKPGDVAVPPGK